MQTMPGAFAGFFHRGGRRPPSPATCLFANRSSRINHSVLEGHTPLSSVRWTILPMSQGRRVYKLPIYVEFCRDVIRPINELSVPSTTRRLHTLDIVLIVCMVYSTPTDTHFYTCRCAIIRVWLRARIRVQREVIEEAYL